MGCFKYVFKYSPRHKIIIYDFYGDFQQKFIRNILIYSKFLLKISLKVITYNLMSKTIFKNTLKTLHSLVVER